MTQENWEREFDEKFELDGDILGPLESDGSHACLTLEDVKDFIRSLRHTWEAEMRERIEELLNDRNKANHIAEATGKTPTNTGPLAQGRIDGYKVGLRDVLASLTPPTETEAEHE